MSYCYSVYGVSVSSDVPFELPLAAVPAAGRPRVRFAEGRKHEFALAAPVDAGDAWFVCRELDSGAVYLRWAGLFEFLVDASGMVVRYRALREGNAAILQNFLFGQTLSFALIRQKVEPVHAAVVDVGGFAIALLGDCTYGKSTLAASLLRAGCRLVSDDVLVANDENGSVIARAGTGRIKLLPDSAQAVLGGTVGGVRLMPRAEKRAYQLNPDLVQPQDVPLRAFVALPTPEERATCERFEISSMPPSELFRELVKNTFVRHVQGGTRLRQNFSSNGFLASAVAGHRLRYPAGIDRLPAVADALLERFRQH